MKIRTLLAALSATLMVGTQVQAQQPAKPVYTQTLNYIKVNAGKGQEWLQFARDTSMKVAQMRADSGEILSWTILRSVYPAGQEARADYIISVISEGEPRSPSASNDEMYKKAGVAMTASEANAKRSTLSSLVAVEMWRPKIYNGAPKKGHYLFLNFMKVRDEAKYDELETTVWSPLSQEWIKQGAMSGWIYATKMLPGGSETAYTAYTADMYPTMEAAFASRSFPETFAKVHPGKNLDDVFAAMTKSRDLARRELWTVVERVTKKQ